MRDVQHRGDLLHLGLHLGLWLARETQREGHVTRDVHVRVQRVVLKHHCNVPGLGFQPTYRFAVEKYLSARQSLQARKHPQRGGLAATRWADQHGELAIFQRQVKGGRTCTAP